MSAGYGHTCAVARVEDGIHRTYCWGANGYGQLGLTLPDGSDTWPLPLRITAFGSEGDSSASVRSLSAGTGHTCALDEDRAVWCWGDDSSGQLGDGMIGPGGPTARLVDGSFTARALSAGMLHTCAVDEENVTWCWGSNAAGQLGAAEPPTSLPNASTPVPVTWQ